MPSNNSNENSGLLPNKVQHGVADDHGESFVNARTTEQKLFVGFLIFVILCVIALGVVVIIDSTTGKFEIRAIQQSDLSANSQLELLNSLWHDKSNMQSGCESTLLLIRHCDKDNDWPEHHGGNSYCSWLGRERSFYFASLFDPKNPDRRYPKPERIFALTQVRDARFEDDDNADFHENYREIETVMPLANMFNKKIEVYSFDAEELARDYFELLQNGEMCGKVTVVSWKHDLIPKLATSLACGPAEGCPYEYPDESFDDIWQIKFVYDPKGKAKQAKRTDPMNLHVETEGPLVLYNKDTGAPKTAADDDGDDDDDDDSVSAGKHRMLKGKAREEEARRMVKHHRGKWVVYGIVKQQNFDPLHYGMKVGDYPPDGSGSPSGGKWADEM